MSSIVISGDTSGAITLAAPAVSGTNTATLPAATGTVMVSGNQPTFSAYLSSAQAMTAASFTLLTCQTKEWDTGTCYNNTSSTATLNGLSAPAWSFCPNVAGYYSVECSVTRQAVSTDMTIAVYKNAASFKQGTTIYVNAGSVAMSCMVYLNGTGDYIQAYGYFTTAQNANPSNSSTYFQATLIRAA
jgi:hypothetical protein